MKNRPVNNELRVEQIDHVELFVPDRKIAANWYRDVLGFEIIDEFAFWAVNPKGPLMIGTKSGGTKLALFEGTSQGHRKTIGFHRVAFRVPADSFLEFISELSLRSLKDDQGRTVSSEHVVNHTKAFSIYFCDPYGHHLELTTYDFEETKLGIEQL